MKLLKKNSNTKAKNTKNTKNMKRKESNKSLYFLLIIISFVITIASVTTGPFIQQSYNIQLEEVSQEKIKAPKIMDNRAATERNMRLAQEAAEKLDPITERNPIVNEQFRDELNTFFVQVDKLRSEQEIQQSEQEVQQNQGIPTQETEMPPPAENVLPDGENALNEDEVASSETEDILTDPVDEDLPQESTSTPVPSPTTVPKLMNLSENSTLMLLEMDESRYETFIDSVYSVSERVLDKGVLELDSKSLQSVKDEMDRMDLNADTRSLGYDIIVSFLRPNVFVNQEATERARKERATEYEKVYYLKNQTIVDEGQIINEEIYAALEDLGYIESIYFENIIPVMGAAALIFVLFLLTLLYIYFFNNNIVQNRNETLLLFTLYISIIILVRVLVGIPFQFLPIYIFTLLLAMLLDSRLASVMNIGVTFICLIIYKGDIDFMLYHLLAGFAMSLISQYTTDRNKIIIAAFLASLAHLIIYVGVFLLIEKQYSQELLYNSIYASAAGMFAVVLCFGSLPIWESCFAVVTTVKLLDLTNPNSDLLRRLAIEAPGTYHHCIIVANLAETAAYDIKANPNLARAGGYYHDIGKLKYPQYFSENMIGENPHEDMDPYSSVQVIKSHITYGLELADHNKLPKVVRDIIAEHHGKSLLKFFYYKSLKEAGSDVTVQSDFRYNFTIPQSKESAVVMLADTVEAAVRSMIPSGKTMDEVQLFVKELVKDKLDDGQLIDSTLTIKDLETIVNSFMRVLKGMYHERIPYPKAEKEETKEETKEEKQVEKEEAKD